MAGSRAILAGPGLPFGLTQPLGAVRTLDIVVGGYLAFSSVLLAIGAAHHFPGCARQLWIALALLSGLVVVCIWSRRSRGWFPILLRLSYGPLLYATWYRQTATIWPVLYDQPLDAFFEHLELSLWGTQPSIAFAQQAPWPWLSELFCSAYYLYYFFTPAMLFAVVFTRGYASAERVIFTATLCFAVFCTLFCVFPTVGPHYWFPPHTGPQLYKGYIFNHLLFFFTASGEVPTGAFPSSHVAVATVLTIQAHRYAPRLFPYMFAVSIVMWPAVVYLHAHYAVDVPVGILMGLLITAVAEHIPLTTKRASVAA